MFIHQQCSIIHCTYDIHFIKSPQPFLCNTSAPSLNLHYLVLLLQSMSFVLYTKHPQGSKTSPLFQSVLLLCLLILGSLQELGIVCHIALKCFFSFGALLMYPFHAFLHLLELTPITLPQIA